MQVCPDCGLREDDDDLNESQPGCRCDRDEVFEFDYDGILADGEGCARTVSFGLVWFFVAAVSDRRH